jgi:RHS repeat-associated protein
VTDYVGNVVYRNGVRHMVLLPEGYLDSASVYHHYVRDHLGNNRVVVSQSGAVVQTNHYYPFGMEFNEEDQQMKNEQPYKFGGKEEQAQHGLNFYDFHARQYDPALGKFTGVDPYLLIFLIFFY